MKRPLAIYYGPGVPATLTKYQRVVVHPAQLPPARVRWLQERGVQVLAYLSLGEDPVGQGPWINHERNHDWHTWLVDLTHPAWHQAISEQVSTYAPLYDGFFLDTVDSATRNVRQMQAMLRLIRLVRQESGAGYLMINRGFSLLHRVRKLVDAVLIEALSTTWYGGYHAYNESELAYTSILVNQARRHRLDIYALDYADSPELRRFALKRALQLGVPTFVSNRELSLPGGYVPAPSKTQLTTQSA